MYKPFIIEFEFPLENTSLKIKLRAEVEQVSEHCFKVHSFHRAKSGPVLNGKLLLPDQDLICLKEEDSRLWVHSDSMKETQLSLVIGKAIDLEIWRFGDLEIG